MRRLLLLVVLVLAGCGGKTVVREPAVQVSGSDNPPVAGAPAPDDAVRIAVVTHGPASSKFWAIIRNGVDAAARRLDVLVDYQAPDVFSVERMSEMIDDAVATNPDGLVVSLPSKGLAPAIRRAVKAGVPVISINSGSDSFRELGVLAHVGQVEDRAGLETGRRLVAAGARKVMCLNHETDNVGVDARCAGIERALREAGGTSTVLPIDDDAPGLPARIAGAAGARGVDAVVATNGPGGLAAAEGLERTDVKVATFDLGPDVIEAVQAGRIDFAVDQQPYLQGYMPIEMLALRARYGIMPAQGDVVSTGPNFVTRSNAAQALELSRRSIR